MTDDSVQLGWFKDLFILDTGKVHVLLFYWYFSSHFYVSPASLVFYSFSEVMQFSNPMHMNLGDITPRAASAMVAFGTKLVIFGGRDADGRTNDVHMIDTGLR